MGPFIKQGLGIYIPAYSSLNWAIKKYHNITTSLLHDIQYKFDHTGIERTIDQSPKADKKLKPRPLPVVSTPCVFLGITSNKQNYSAINT